MGSWDSWRLLPPIYKRGYSLQVYSLQVLKSERILQTSITLIFKLFNEALVLHIDEVGEITLLGKHDYASVWYQVLGDSIVLKYLRFKVIYLLQAIYLIVISISKNFY